MAQALAAVQDNRPTTRRTDEAEAITHVRDVRPWGYGPLVEPNVALWTVELGTGAERVGQRELLGRRERVGALHGIGSLIVCPGQRRHLRYGSLQL